MVFFLPGQARLDGAFCEYEEEDKMKFLQELRSKGVCNIEMESLGFLAMCHYAGVKGLIKKSVYTLRKWNIETEVLNCDMNMSTLGKENPSDASFRTVAFPIIFYVYACFFSLFSVL